MVQSQLKKNDKNISNNEKVAMIEHKEDSTDKAHDSKISYNSEEKNAQADSKMHPGNVKEFKKEDKKEVDNDGKKKTRMINQTRMVITILITLRLRKATMTEKIKITVKN